MKNGYGSTFHSMRKNKNYSLRDVSLDYISIAQLSKFERGDSDITLNKLAPLLDNITLSTSEFISELPPTQFEDQMSFLEEISQSYLLSNQNKQELIQSITKEIARLTLATKPSSATKVYLSLLQLINQILTEKPITSTQSFLKTEVIEYLFGVERWYKFELLAFVNILPILELDFIKSACSELMRRVADIDCPVSIKNNLVDALLQTSVYLTRHKQNITAKNILSKFSKIALPEQLFFKKILVRFFLAYTQFKEFQSTTNQKTITEILVCLESYDYPTRANQLRNFLADQSFG